MQQTWDNNLRQRKIKKMEKEIPLGKTFKSSGEHSAGSLPDAVGYGLLFIFLICLKIFSTLENNLPQQISVKEASFNPGRFIGERAQMQLKRLTDLGTRVVGSYQNEVLAVDFLKREISFIAQEANKIHNIEVNIQKPTGSYFLFLRPYGFRNYYLNIQNVVVKLSSNNSSNSSVLMNCHFDTVPESPGASDNGINCVIMLEILRVLSSGTIPLKSNIIFLFNGAEENPLQASHGFLSQHKWSKEVKAVINLDSGGAGGKEILFQTSGESWLIKAYARSVPRPSAGVQGEELFHFGIIPSDTDFRIFRDFGHYAGFDLAHCTNGYIYHTKFDRMEYIDPGVYQHTGDNMLALVKEVANSPELDSEHTKTRIVYFDVFNLFVVFYTEDFGIFFNIMTVIFSVGTILRTYQILPDFKYFLKYLSLTTGGQLLALLLAVAVVFCLSKTLDIYKSTLSWYLRPWLIVPLYVFPIVIAMVATILLLRTRMKKDMDGHAVIRFINGAQLLWTIVLLLGTLKGIRSSFILMLIVLFPSVGSLVVTSFKKSISVKIYLAAYMVCLVFPTLFTLQQCVRVFTTIIPMAGRMGPHTNPELIIGILTFIMTATYLAQIVPILLLIKKLKVFLIVLSIIHILAMVGVVCTEYGFPYVGDTRRPALQRFYVFHGRRTFQGTNGSMRKSDSGFFVQSMDRNNINYVSTHVPELLNAKSISDDCSTALYCGFPIFTSRFIKPASYSYLVPSSPPPINRPTSFEVVNQTQLSVTVRRIRLLVSGPDHITVGLSPSKGVKLLKWSFDAADPIESERWNNRKTYMIYFSYGSEGNFEFFVDLKIPQQQPDNLLEVAVIGHYMHDKKIWTKEFKQFLSKFPDWAHVTPWITTYESWVV